MVSWQLTIDCADPAAMVRFWAEALDYEPQPAPQPHPTWNHWYRSVGVPAEELDLSTDGCDRIHDPDGGGPPIWFQVVPEAKAGKNRLHLDLYPAGRDRGEPVAERKERIGERVDELVSLGATVLRRPIDPEAESHCFMLLADPEGNEFCVG